MKKTKSNLKNKFIVAGIMLALYAAFFFGFLYLPAPFNFICLLLLGVYFVAFKSLSNFLFKKFKIERKTDQ